MLLKLQKIVFSLIVQHLNHLDIDNVNVNVFAVDIMHLFKHINHLDNNWRYFYTITGDIVAFDVELNAHFYVAIIGEERLTYLLIVFGLDV